MVGSIVSGSVSFQVEDEPETVLGPGDVFFAPEGARIARFDARGDHLPAADPARRAGWLVAGWLLALPTGTAMGPVVPDGADLSDGPVRHARNGS